MLDLLGEGAFGKVRLAVDESTGKEYAMKIMDKSHIKANELTLQVRREIAVMKAMRHRKFFASQKKGEKRRKKKKNYIYITERSVSHAILSASVFPKLLGLTLSVLCHAVLPRLLLSLKTKPFCTLQPHQPILSTSMKSSHRRRTSTWSWT